MTPSAGTRERRILSTSNRLTELAREWTIERGLNGFTVEELCAAVDVSRRTFFNYFASKDDAVLGIRTRADHVAIEERFLAAGGAPADDRPSEGLLADLAELMIGRWEELGPGAQDVSDLRRAVEAAPRLLVRIVTMSREQEQADTALVEQREGLAPGDLRASTAVHLLGSLLRAAADESFCGDGRTSLRDAFTRRLAAARTVFSV